MTASTKDQYRNATEGHLGVTLKDADGKLKGKGLRPGESCLMDEDERTATALAPRNPANNPFANGDLELIARAQERKHIRPIDVEEAPQEAPAAEPEEEAGGMSDEELERAEKLKADAEKKAEAKAQREQAAKQAAGSERKKQEANTKAAAERSAQPPIPPDRGTGQAAAKPAQGSRAAGEEVATPVAS